MRGRFCPGDGFDSNRTVIEVDVAAGLILIGVFHVVLRTGDHHLFEAPDVLNIVGKLPHQNIKTVGIFDPGFVIGIAFLVVEQEMSNGAIKASARYFSSFRVRVVFVFMQVAGGVLRHCFYFYLPAYSPRYAPLYPRTGS